MSVRRRGWCLVFVFVSEEIFFTIGSFRFEIGRESITVVNLPIHRILCSLPSHLSPRTKDEDYFSDSETG